MKSDLIQALSESNQRLKEAIGSNTHSLIEFELGNVHSLAKQLASLDVSSISTVEKDQIKTAMRDFSISSAALQQLKSIHEKHLKRVRGSDLVYGPKF